VSSHFGISSAKSRPGDLCRIVGIVYGREKPFLSANTIYSYHVGRGDFVVVIEFAEDVKRELHHSGDVEWVKVLTHGGTMWIFASLVMTFK